MAPTLRPEGEPPPTYGADSDEFTVEVHHGGFFVGQGSSRLYMNEKVNWFDYCEGDTWSPLWFDDFVGQLGYEASYSLRIYWLLPGKDLSDGLRMVSTDNDTRLMVSVVDKVRNFVIFFYHDDNISGSNWDDIVVNPIASLPNDLSPSKAENVEKKREENLPQFYDDVEKVIHDVVTAAAGTSRVRTDEDSESETNSYVVDSDYDLEDEDDDLFVHNVDEDVVDGGKQSIPKRKIVSEQDGDDVSSEEDGLDLPQSDDEGQVRMRFKGFRDTDLENPIFKVGIVFDSVQMLRKAITEYSLKHRVQISMLRNEKTRLQAQCADGCPWYLYAAKDKRTNGLLVKIYTDNHNCQKQWVLKRCTANWLASKYLEIFRADQKMTLANFARTVQKDMNITPARTKLQPQRLEQTHEEVGYEDEGPVISQVSMHFAELSQPLLSELSNIMMFQLDAEHSSQINTRELQPPPLPDSTFIMSNIPAARPVPPTTASRKGTTRSTKRKATTDAASKAKKATTDAAKKSKKAATTKKT